MPDALLRLGLSGEDLGRNALCRTSKPYHEDLSFEFSANYDTLKLYNKANLDSHTRKLYKGEFMDLFFRDGK